MYAANPKLKASRYPPPFGLQEDAAMLLSRACGLLPSRADQLKAQRHLWQVAAMLELQMGRAAPEVAMEPEIWESGTKDATTEAEAVTEPRPTTTEGSTQTASPPNRMCARTQRQRP